MAADGANSIMLDLQKHLQNAKLQVNNLSTIAQKGDEKELKLVEKFMSETIFVKAPTGERDLADNQADILQSQLYVACFWGFRDVVKGILELAPEINVDSQNRGSLWTPLHAATFQEHGPIIMQLLEKGAQPELADSEGRTPKDFASASDKIWGHFAAQSLKKTPRAKLMDMGIIKKTEGAVSPRGAVKEPGAGIHMASYDNPDANQGDDSNHIQAASTGDVLAGDTDTAISKSNQPQFTAYK